MRSYYYVLFLILFSLALLTACKETTHPFGDLPEWVLKPANNYSGMVCGVYSGNDMVMRGSCGNPDLLQGYLRMKSLTGPTSPDSKLRFAVFNISYDTFHNSSGTNILNYEITNPYEAVYFCGFNNTPQEYWTCIAQINYSQTKRIQTTSCGDSFAAKTNGDKNFPWLFTKYVYECRNLDDPDIFSSELACFNNIEYTSENWTGIIGCSGEQKCCLLKNISQISSCRYINYDFESTNGKYYVLYDECRNPDDTDIVDCKEPADYTPKDWQGVIGCPGEQKCCSTQKSQGWYDMQNCRLLYNKKLNDYIAQQTLDKNCKKII